MKRGLKKWKIILPALLVLVAVSVLTLPFLLMPRATEQTLVTIAQETIARQAAKPSFLPDAQPAQGLDVAPGRAVFNGSFAAVSGKMTTDFGTYSYGVLFKKLPFSDVYFCDTRCTVVADSQFAIFSTFPTYGLVYYRFDIGPNALRMECALSWGRVVWLAILAYPVGRLLLQKRKVRHVKEKK